MNLKKKEQIRTMRLRGCSYDQISKLLRLPKSTVSTYCHTKKIYPEDETRPDFRLCKECGELFIAKTRRDHWFCSSGCRLKSWRRQKAMAEVEEALIQEISELDRPYESTGSDDSREVLDFFGKESDEWYMKNPPLIGRRKLSESETG